MPKDSARSAQELQAGLLQLVHRLRDIGGVIDDDEVVQVVGTAARLAGAERSLLRMIDPEGEQIAVYIWAEDGRAEDPFVEITLPGAREMFAWTTRRYMAGAITMVEELDELPEEAKVERSFLAKRGVRSWLTIPFQSRGVAIGYQSFETFGYAKRWSDEEVSALQLTAEILASTIMRVRAEQAGRESEERFFRVFNDHPDAMVIARLEDAAIVECNPAWVQLAGIRSASEAIGRSVYEFAPDVGTDVIKNVGRKLAAEGETEEMEFRDAQDGRAERIVQAATALIDFAGETCALTTVRDVTERRRLQEQLQQAQKLEAVGLLAGGIAHDFNNMLTVIQGHSEILSQALEGPLGENALAIEDAAKRSSRLTRQLLVFSRGDMHSPIVVAPNQLIEDLEPMLRSTLGETIHMSTEYDPEVPGVLADPSRLEQALMNLVLNARDACTQGRGNIALATRRTHIQAGDHPPLKAGDYAVLEVRDDGRGMAPEVLERVTEPFYTTKLQGTGLGLAIVHGVVRQGHGDLVLESKPGQGTTARILLPAAESAPREQEASRSQDPIAIVSEPLCILLVEDEDMVRALARRVLEAGGHRVVEAVDGFEALQKAQEIPGGPGALVTDIVMPRIGGMSLAEELRVRSPELPIVVVSGYPDSGSDPGAGKLPRDMVFLVKPYQPAGLLAALEDARALFA
ncbi:MAG: response regulator [bacterium]|nr:response regulator [bacterium]